MQNIFYPIVRVRRQHKNVHFANLYNLKIDLENQLYFFISIGLCQVLLQTKTNPNHVVNGLGITYDEAFEQAAFTFLELIKLLCNR